MPDETPTDPASTDPFWAPVRRRHPDVDVVLLPPEQAAPGPGPDADPTEPEQADDPDQLVTEAADLLRALWTTAVGDGEPSETQQRWSHGSTAGTQRLETTWTRQPGGPDEDGEGGEPIAPETAQAVVRRAAEALDRAGWHVLAPADGLPRVQAGRADGLDRAELLLLVVPETGRLVLRHRTGARVVAR